MVFFFSLYIFLFVSYFVPSLTAFFMISEGMEKTMQDYEDWTTEPMNDALDKSYKKALSKLEQCLPFEDSLVCIHIHILKLVKSTLENLFFYTYFYYVKRGRT